jgi:hypothetical protein
MTDKTLDSHCRDDALLELANAYADVDAMQATLAGSHCAAASTAACQLVCRLVRHVQPCILPDNSNLCTIAYFSHQACFGRLVVAA